MKTDTETKQKTSVWQSTRVQNLYRHKGGNYYGRFKVAGHTRWLSLKTTVFSTAKLRLADEARTISEKRAVGVTNEATSLTFEQIAEIYTARFQADPELSPATKLSRVHALARIRKTWPEFIPMKPVKVTAAMIADWSNRLRTATKFKRHGAKTEHTGYAADSVNKCLETINRLLTIAVEYGSIMRNPLDSAPSNLRLRHAVRPAKPILPSTEKMRQLLDEFEMPIEIPPELANMADSIRPLINRDRLDVGEFARFLAYSGARLKEAGAMTWAQVKAKTLMIPGTKTEAADREIPQIPSMLTLLAAIRARRVSEGMVKDASELTGPIFRVKECQKSIDRACKALKIARLTHHDFRHYFATVCIESGVDIPTVARWLGHADGGALAMKTYGHLRQEHSLAQAAKVAI
ncbi:MAG: tyrosine-type recombinase/integrase [Opitutaceae bacterium]|jgi:integrase